MTDRYALLTGRWREEIGVLVLMGLGGMVFINENIETSPQKAQTPITQQNSSQPSAVSLSKQGS